MADDASDADPEEARVGLCLRCRHARAQPTRRGVVFYRCGRSEQDERFLRYPPLPVLRCPGFEVEADGPPGDAEGSSLGADVDGVAGSRSGGGSEPGSEAG